MTTSRVHPPSIDHRSALLVWPPLAPHLTWDPWQIPPGRIRPAGMRATGLPLHGPTRVRAAQTCVDTQRECAHHHWTRQIGSGRPRDGWLRDGRLRNESLVKRWTLGNMRAVQRHVGHTNLGTVPEFVHVS